jgi:hypothetical protein
LIALFFSPRTLLAVIVTPVQIRSDYRGCTGISHQSLGPGSGNPRISHDFPTL